MVNSYLFQVPQNQLKTNVFDYIQSVKQGISYLLRCKKLPQTWWYKISYTYCLSFYGSVVHAQLSWYLCFGVSRKAAEDVGQVLGFISRLKSGKIEFQDDVVVGRVHFLTGCWTEGVSFLAVCLLEPALSSFPSSLSIGSSQLSSLLQQRQQGRESAIKLKLQFFATQLQKLLPISFPYSVCQSKSGLTHPRGWGGGGDFPSA